MAKRLARLLRGFPPAWQGLGHVLATERHARFHLLATVTVALLGWTLGLERMEWTCIILSMGLVWTTEILNTAVERLADRVTGEPDPLIGKAKDLAAGAVLVAAIVAVVVGALIFAPKLSL
jgi:diacylglycerol kinase